MGQRLIEEMKQVRRSGCEKPLHICWVAGQDAEPNRQRLVRAGIPCHKSTSSTARILAHCLQPPRPRDVETVTHALSPPRSITEEGWIATDEVYALLCSAELPVVSYRIVGNVKSASAAASAIGFPVTVKVIRPGLVHKFKAGAVVLNVSEPDTLDETLCRLERKWGSGPYLIQQQASAGVEWLIGAVRDLSYGRVVLFGPGGIWAEALDDVSVRLAPFAVEEGLGMLADIRCQRFFDGLGSFSSVDRQALAALLAKLSHWVSSSPWLAELDLNPVIANEQGLHVVDARMRAVPTDPVS